MEAFFQVALGMNCLHYLFNRLRDVPAAGIRQRVRFLNRELSSTRLRLHVAGILNKLMYDHVITTLCLCTTFVHIAVERGMSIHDIAASQRNRPRGGAMDFDSEKPAALVL